MTRGAILISSPGEQGEETYCKGVYVDVENYVRLLKSPEGGSWEDKEITVLDQPTAAKVRLELLLLSFTDYVLVMFTGHGWYSAPDRDCILQLKKGEQIASLELKKGARRRTIILDCCQKIYPVSFLEERSVAFAAKKAAVTRKPDRIKCRSLFDKSVQAADPGILVLNSCTTGELSSDHPERGAHYNGSLIECADDWALAQSKILYGTDSVLSCIMAHECAAQKTKELSGGQQNPIAEKPKTAPYFPISVFA